MILFQYFWVKISGYCSTLAKTALNITDGRVGAGGVGGEEG